MSDQQEAVLERLTHAVERLERRLEESDGRAVYDAKALKDMGVPHHRAYEILRAHGVRGPGGNGKLLITRAALEAALTPIGGRE